MAETTLYKFIQTELDRKGSLSQDFVRKATDDLSISTVRIKGVPNHMLAKCLHKPTGYTYATTSESTYDDVAINHARNVFIAKMLNLAGSR